MATSTTFDGTGMTLQQKLAVAGEIVCQTCPTCGGSGSGSGAGGHASFCCGVLPDTIHVSITGATAIDGSYALTWTNDPAIYTFANITVPGSGWCSPLTFQFQCTDFSFVTEDYYFMLGFDIGSCNFTWYQWKKWVSGGFSYPGYLPVGAFQATYIGACDITAKTCSPFHINKGMQAVSLMSAPIHDCSTASEVVNICHAPWTGAKMELTL